MDAVELARRLQEEATCSICLDYFIDPVMTVCGHNFCRECIQLSWEKGKGKKGRRKRRGSFPCPECREISPQRNLRPNRLLTKVAEMARQHPGLQKRDLCKIHQELLKLFCQEDQSPICVVCRESREHRLHTVFPIDEAIQDYKEKLEENMEYLREEMMKTEAVLAREDRTMKEWQGLGLQHIFFGDMMQSITATHAEKVKNQRDHIMMEFEKMCIFLAEEEQRLLQALKKEEDETSEKLHENKAILDEQSCSLEMLILELEDKREHSALQMLQDMNHPLDRVKNLRTQYPEAIPIGLKTVCKVPGQIEVLRCFQVDVVPDPATAYPYLVLYESRQRCYLNCPVDSTFHGKDRFLAYPCMVGQTAFSAGRYYWEVGMNLTGEALWALGVCRDNISRKERVPKSPENGFWVVQLSKGKKYLPMLSAATPFTLLEPPSHVGIFLDYEAGDVSFYNVNNGSHLHTYSQATFLGPLQPFFCLGAPKTGQMVISTVTAWVKG